VEIGVGTPMDPILLVAVSTLTGASWLRSDAEHDYIEHQGMVLSLGS
jgi:hypothetical protein